MKRVEEKDCWRDTVPWRHKARGDSVSPKFRLRPRPTRKIHSQMSSKNPRPPNAEFNELPETAGPATTTWISRSAGGAATTSQQPEFVPTSLVPFNGYTAPNYLTYPLHTEFTDTYSTPNGFFPCASLPYALNYQPEAVQRVKVDEQEEDVSDYSGNSTDDTSRSPSTDSSKKENPTYYAEVKPLPYPSIAPHGYISRSPFETFCTVPGRTSLLSSTTKYKVTIGEIQRRISPPECLNASLLGGILRKAKSKDGGKALRESLRRIGLTLPAGRRKSAHVTALTALVEEEAVHMARDFHSVCERDFPAKELAAFLSRNVSNEADAQNRRTMLHYVRMFIKELSDLMNSDRSPVCANRPDIILDPIIQKPLTHFSMVTHGFGGLVVVSVLDALNAHVHESFKHLDRTFGPTNIYNNPNQHV